jgi:hypothetical protein
MNKPAAIPAQAIDPKEFQPYDAAGSTLMPLGRWNAKTDDGKSLAKIPRKGWREVDWDAKSIIESAIHEGHNVANRIEDGFLVLDHDDRNNFGDDIKSNLRERFDLDPANCPTVDTANGFHLYLRVPKGFKARNTIPDLQSVECKGLGRYVVAAGSRHPSGKLYRWRKDRPTLKDAPMAPAKLLEAIKRPERVASFAPDSARIEPEQLASILEALNVEDFGSNDAWFPVLAASHHATGGAGVDEFVAWSTSDPAFADQGPTIEARWESLDKDKAGGYTIGTLNKLLSDHGRSDLIVRDKIDAAEEFAAFIEKNPDTKIDGEPGASVEKTDGKSERSVTGIKPGTFKGDSYRTLKNLPDPKWLVFGFLAENCLFEIFGQFKAGKTFFGMELALCMATGTMFFDTKTTGKGGVPVLYIIAEGNRKMFALRIEQWIKKHAKAKADRGALEALVEKNLVIVSRPVKFDTKEQVTQFALDNPGAWKAVFVDTLMRNMQGDPMKPADMIAFMEGCDRLRLAPSKPAVIFLHHMRREGGTGGYGPIIGEAFVDGAAIVTRAKSRRIFKVKILRDADDSIESWVCHINSVDLFDDNARTVGVLEFKGRGGDPRDKILVCLYRVHPDSNLALIAETGVPKRSVQAILKALRDEGLVEADRLKLSDKGEQEAKSVSDGDD